MRAVIPCPRRTNAFTAASGPSLMLSENILLDGTTTVMLIHRDLEYVEAAGQMARSLVESARR